MRAIPFIACSIIILLCLMAAVHYVVVPVIYPCNSSNNTITINHTVYTERVVEREVYVDTPCNTTPRTIYLGNRSGCDVSLIKQIEQLEATISRWAMNDLNITINETINSTNNQTNTTEAD